MTQLTLSIPDEKLEFMIELLKSFGFVKIEAIDGIRYEEELPKEKE